MSAHCRALKTSAARIHPETASMGAAPGFAWLRLMRCP